VNAAGLVLTAAGMLVQIAAGSTLYPSITGPIVLIVAAIFVAFGPAAGRHGLGSWSRSSLAWERSSPRS
jgi:hypothetical protein